MSKFLNCSKNAYQFCQCSRLLPISPLAKSSSQGWRELGRRVAQPFLCVCEQNMPPRSLGAWLLAHATVCNAGVLLLAICSWSRTFLQSASKLCFPDTLHRYVMFCNYMLCFAIWVRYFLQIWVEQNPKQFKNLGPSLQLLTRKTVRRPVQIVVLQRECCPALWAYYRPVQDLPTTPQEPPPVAKQTLITRNNVTKADYTDSFLQVKCAKVF